MKSTAFTAIARQNSNVLAKIYNSYGKQAHQACITPMQESRGRISISKPTSEQRCLKLVYQPVGGHMLFGSSLFSVAGPQEQTTKVISSEATGNKDITPTNIGAGRRYHSVVECILSLRPQSGRHPKQRQGSLGEYYLDINVVQAICGLANTWYST